MLKKTHKKAQEEIVGFAMIIIIVAVIILVFLSISISRSSKEEPIKSYEVGSFIHSFMQYTTDCSIDYTPNFREIRSLIKDCLNRKTCEDGREACYVLNSTLNEIVEESWKIGEDRPIKAYELKILFSNSDEAWFELKQGNGSSFTDYKGSIESIDNNDVVFNVFY